MAGRGAFDTRIGFLMAAVGSAVGLGNLWRFPYLVSQNGGAVFLGIYVVFLFLIGIPALMAELSVGRARQRNAVQAFEKDKRGWSYSWIGILFLFTAMLLLSYYSVIAGWALNYLFNGIAQSVQQEAPGFWGRSEAYFGDLSTSPTAIVFHFAFMAITIGILIRGVSRGIERANLIMMPILFLFVVGLAIYGNFQPGAGAGRSFYFEPDLAPYKEFSVLRTVLSDAAGQTFFSIGLGLGTMLTYASYVGRDNDLQATGVTIAVSDTLVAIVAGLMVFPLMFSLGLEGLIATDSSVGGLFIILPTAFHAIGGWLGLFLAIGFFLMLGFAALSSALSLLEVPVSYMVDRWPDWGRARAVLLLGMGVYIMGLPSAIWLEWLDFADRLVGNVLLLLGGLLLVLYLGWLRPDLMEELRVGAAKRRIDPFPAIKAVIRYPLPVFLAILLVFGIINFFSGVAGGG